MASPSVFRLARAVDRRLRLENLSPGTRILSRFLDTIYYTSLKTEEGRPIQLRIVLVDPVNPNPTKKKSRRPDRWRIVKLGTQLPFTVAVVSKMAMAADPWSSSLAVYFDTRGNFFIWGLVDQTVHFNAMLVHETYSMYVPPPLGICQVIASGAADLTVYREYDFVARLAQEILQTRQMDIFSSGPLRKKLLAGFGSHLQTVWEYHYGRNDGGIEIPEEWSLFVRDSQYDDNYLAFVIDVASDIWFGSLCRLLISIQRYRHGGALLISPSKSGLNIKYRINYSRLRTAMGNAALWQLEWNSLHEAVWFDCVDKNEDIPSDLYKRLDEAGSRVGNFTSEITGCVRFIASLSRVDGLVLATPDLVVRGFGVEIKTKKEVENIFLASTPEARASSLRRISSNHFGTRHRSMMRYCFANANSVGFVLSQDGDIRAMTRVKNRLVVWENPKVLSFSPSIPEDEGHTPDEERNSSLSRADETAEAGDKDDFSF